MDGEVRCSEGKYFGEHKTALCEILALSVRPDVSTSVDTAPGLITVRAPSYHIYALTDHYLDIPLLPEDLEENISFVPDDANEEIAAGTRLIVAILTVDGACMKCFYSRQHALEGPRGWCIESLVLQYDEAEDWYRRVGLLSITSKESEGMATESALLTAFGLRIQDSFGGVITTDESNWAVLRII